MNQLDVIYCKSFIEFKFYSFVTENRPLEVVKTGSGFSPMPVGLVKKFVRYEHRKSGKTALSLDYAIKQVPPEVVKIANKNSPGAAVQMVRTEVI